MTLDLSFFEETITQSKAVVGEDGVQLKEGVSVDHRDADGAVFSIQQIQRASIEEEVTVVKQRPRRRTWDEVFGLIHQLKGGNDGALKRAIEQAMLTDLWDQYVQVLKPYNDEVRAIEQAEHDPDVPVEYPITPTPLPTDLNVEQWMLENASILRSAMLPTGAEKVVMSIGDFEALVVKAEEQYPSI